MDTAEELPSGVVAAESIQYVNTSPGSLPAVMAEAFRLIVAGAQTGKGSVITRLGIMAGCRLAPTSVVHPMKSLIRNV